MVRFVTRTAAPRRAAANAARRPILPTPTTRTVRPSNRASPAEIRSSAVSASERGGPENHARARRPAPRATWKSRSRSGSSGAPPRRSDRVSRSWCRIWSSPMTALSRPHATVMRWRTASASSSTRPPGGSGGIGPSPYVPGATYASTRWQVRTTIIPGLGSRAASAAANASRRSLGTRRACATNAMTEAERAMTKALTGWSPRRATAKPRRRRRRSRASLRLPRPPRLSRPHPPHRPYRQRPPPPHRPPTVRLPGVG